MASKNPIQRAATKQKIENAYVSLLRKRPHSAITASSVIKEANVNRSTFYQYFDSVIDLQRSIETELLASMQQIAQEAIASTNGLDVTRIVSRIYVEYGDLIGLLLGSSGSMRFTSKVKEQLKPLVTEVLSVSVPLNSSSYIAEFVIGGLLSAYTLWFEQEQNLPLEELVPLVRSMVFACLETIGEFSPFEM